MSSTKFLTPKNEKGRLKALDEYDILHTATEEEYDRITKIAAEIFNVPVTFIAFLDEYQQWNKSVYGIDMKTISREIAFCNHTILNPDDILIVRDLRKDKRFAKNPLVTDGANVVFYAGAPLTTSKGFVLGSLCLLDVKERVMTETQIEAFKSLSREIMAKLELRKKIKLLKKAEKRLKKANVQLKEFARLVSHDIKTPVVSISILTSYLAKKFKDTDAEAHESINLIRDSSKELLIFIDDMLRQSESKGLNSRIRKTSCSRAVLESIIKLTATDNSVIIELEGNFPKARIDKSSLQQVFQNIISNAIKYTDKSKTHINIKSSSDKTYHYFTVTDNGNGISKKDLPQLFKYGTELIRKDKFGNIGNGSGLARIKDIIETHKGYITVTSEPKIGTAFTIALQKH